MYQEVLEIKNASLLHKLVIVTSLSCISTFIGQLMSFVDFGAKKYLSTLIPTRYLQYVLE